MVEGICWEAVHTSKVWCRLWWTTQRVLFGAGGREYNRVLLGAKGKIIEYSLVQGGRNMLRSSNANPPFSLHCTASFQSTLRTASNLIKSLIITTTICHNLWRVAQAKIWILWSKSESVWIWWTHQHKSWIYPLVSYCGPLWFSSWSCMDRYLEDITLFIQLVQLLMSVCFSQSISDRLGSAPFLVLTQKCITLNGGESLLAFFWS